MDMEQRIEQRATNIQAAEGFVITTCRRIARAEIEREGRLVEAMKEVACERNLVGCPCGSCARFRAALSAYDAEFAPKRTVEQIAKDLAEAWGPRGYVSPKREYRYEELLDELADALKAKDGK